MALKGTAFIIMWHDIAAEGDADYNRWHTRQHMPERLDHPGFLRSRRGINRGADHQVYFTVYEGEALATFVSPEYSHSLNNPTAWTQSVAPHFRHFLRVACAVVHSGGRGVGGGLISARLRLPAGLDEAAAIERLVPVLDTMADSSTAISAVHLAAARPDYSSQKTSETSLRPPMHEEPFDLVCLIETIGLPEAEAEASAIAAGLAAAGFAGAIVQSYDVAYTLERRDAA